jgi:long-chain acyl-CoA synthetase
MSFSLSIARLCHRIGFQSRVADALAFDAARRGLGGSLEWFVVAGESFSRETHVNLSAILGIDIVAIYGLSEAGGAVSATDWRAVAPGTVGSLVPGTEVRFSDAGEILLRSRGAFTTYWQAPDVHAAAHVDGWFRTNDRGTVDAAGNLIVPGRVFEMLEFEPGLELALPFLAMSYKKNTLITDIFITSHSERKNTLIAVAVTTVRWVEYAYNTPELTVRQAENYAHHPFFCDWIRKDLRRLARFEGLPHYAYIAGIRLTVIPFTSDERLHTPTGKQRPSAFIERFAREFEDIKNEINQRHTEKRIGPEDIEYDDETDPPDE